MFSAVCVCVCVAMFLESFVYYSCNDFFFFCQIYIADLVLVTSGIPLFKITCSKLALQRMGLSTPQTGTTSWDLGGHQQLKGQSWVYIVVTQSFPHSEDFSILFLHLSLTIFVNHFDFILQLFFFFLNIFYAWFSMYQHFNFFISIVLGPSVQDSVISCLILRKRMLSYLPDFYQCIPRTKKINAIILEFKEHLFRSIKLKKFSKCGKPFAVSDFPEYC